VGGALRTNAGDRSGDIGQFVRQVEVLDRQGTVQVRERDELHFSEHTSNLDDPVLLGAEFVLEVDQADAIVKRMRKAWIIRKAAQPAAFQAIRRIFKNPRGLSAAALIEKTGLGQAKVGGAQVSDRDANCIVLGPGATSRDVLRLIDLMRAKVQEHFSIDLEQEIAVW
jgi:UDP-N-acetylmuramate dehydrogenase